MNDRELRDKLWDLVYGLLDAEEEAALEERIHSEPTVARLYAEISLEAELVATAAKIERAPLPLSLEPRVAPTIKSAVVEKISTRWMNLSISLVALLLLGVIGWSYWPVPQPLANVPLAAVKQEQRKAKQPLVLYTAVHGPAEITAGTSHRFRVETWQRDQQPVSATLELAVRDDQQIRFGTQFTTNAEGWAEVQVPGEALLQAGKLVVTKAAIADSNWDLQPLVADVDVQPDSLVARLEIDRPIVKPGETVFFRAVTLGSESLVAQNEVEAEFELFDAAGEPVPGSRRTDVTQDGVAAGEAILPSNAPEGYYELAVRSPKDAFPEERLAMLVRNEGVQSLLAAQQFTDTDGMLAYDTEALRRHSLLNLEMAERAGSESLAGGGLGNAGGRYGGVAAGSGLEGANQLQEKQLQEEVALVDEKRSPEKNGILRKSAIGEFSDGEQHANGKILKNARRNELESLQGNREKSADSPRGGAPPAPAKPLPAALADAKPKGEVELSESPSPAAAPERSARPALPAAPPVTAAAPAASADLQAPQAPAENPSAKNAPAGTSVAGKKSAQSDSTNEPWFPSDKDVSGARSAGEKKQAADQPASGKPKALADNTADSQVAVAEKLRERYANAGAAETAPPVVTEPSSTNGSRDVAKEIAPAAKGEVHRFQSAAASGPANYFYRMPSQQPRVAVDLQQQDVDAKDGVVKLRIATTTEGGIPSAAVLGLRVVNSEVADVVTHYAPLLVDRELSEFGDAQPGSDFVPSSVPDADEDRLLAQKKLKETSREEFRFERQSDKFSESVPQSEAEVHATDRAWSSAAETRSLAENLPPSERYVVLATNESTLPKSQQESLAATTDPELHTKTDAPAVIAPSIGGTIGGWFIAAGVLGLTIILALRIRQLPVWGPNWGLALAVSGLSLVLGLFQVMQQRSTVLETAAVAPQSPALPQAMSPSAGEANSPNVWYDNSTTNFAKKGQALGGNRLDHLGEPAPESTRGESKPSLEVTPQPAAVDANGREDEVTKLAENSLAMRADTTGAPLRSRTLNEPDSESKQLSKRMDPSVEAAKEKQMRSSESINRETIVAGKEQQSITDGAAAVKEVRAALSSIPVTVFWKPRIVTDAQGIAEVAIPLPEKGRYRVVVEAHAPGRLGKGELEIVRDPMPNASSPAADSPLPAEPKERPTPAQPAQPQP